MFDAKPEDREQIALYIQEIEIDHRPGKDGNLIDDVRIYFGKKGTANYQLIHWASMLPKHDPMLWDKFGPAIEKWKQTQTLPVEGTPIEAWPAITKGQIKACRNIGLRSVEDIANATDAIREKLGMGTVDLINKAKAYLANREGSATANRIATLEGQVQTLIEELKTARETNDKLAAEKGRKVGRPPKQQKEAA